MFMAIGFKPTSEINHKKPTVVKCGNPHEILSGETGSPPFFSGNFLEDEMGSNLKNSGVDQVSWEIHFSV